MCRPNSSSSGDGMRAGSRSRGCAFRAANGLRLSRTGATGETLRHDPIRGDHRRAGPSNRLLVVTDQAVQDALADAGDFSSWIGGSALIIGVATPNGQERPFDVGRQAQNMMIAVHADGVGCCPVTLHHPDRVQAAVGLPDHWSMSMSITFGYPVENHPDSPLKGPRCGLDELVRYDRWS